MSPTNVEAKTPRLRPGNWDHERASRWPGPCHLAGAECILELPAQLGDPGFECGDVGRVPGSRDTQARPCRQG